MVSPVVYVALYAVTIVTNFVHFPLKVMNDHRPRPMGSSPLATTREVQESHRIVAVQKFEAGHVDSNYHSFLVGIEPLPYIPDMF